MVDADFFNSAQGGSVAPDDVIAALQPDNTIASMPKPSLANPDFAQLAVVAGVECVLGIRISYSGSQLRVPDQIAIHGLMRAGGSLQEGSAQTSRRL